MELYKKGLGVVLPFIVASIRVKVPEPNYLRHTRLLYLLATAAEPDDKGIMRNEVLKNSQGGEYPPCELEIPDWRYKQPGEQPPPKQEGVKPVCNFPHCSEPVMAVTETVLDRTEEKEMDKQQEKEKTEKKEKRGEKPDPGWAVFCKQHDPHLAEKNEEIEALVQNLRATRMRTLETDERLQAISREDYIPLARIISADQKWIVFSYTDRDPEIWEDLEDDTGEPVHDSSADTGSEHDAYITNKQYYATCAGEKAMMAEIIGIAYYP